MVVGSVLFNILATVVPPSLRWLFDPAAVLCAGFSSTYFWTTVLNCFGALLLATSVYGLLSSVMLRIYDNLVGALFALVCIGVFSVLESRSAQEKP